MTTNFHTLARYSRQAVIINYVLLLIIFSLGTLVWPSCNRSPNLVIWGIHMLLMLSFLPAIIKQQVRAHAWMTFVLLGFFLVAVDRVFACTSWLAVLEVLVITVLFIAAMMYIRWRSKALKQE